MKRKAPQACPHILINYWDRHGSLFSLRFVLKGTRYSLSLVCFQSLSREATEWTACDCHWNDAMRSSITTCHLSIWQRYTGFSNQSLLLLHCLCLYRTGFHQRQLWLKSISTLCLLWGGKTLVYITSFVVTAAVEEHQNIICPYGDNELTTHVTHIIFLYRHFNVVRIIKGLSLKKKGWTQIASHTC